MAEAEFLAPVAAALIYSLVRNGDQMRALLQRVTGATVEAGGQTIGSIDRGVVTLLGVAAGDGSRDAQYLADRILHLRIFEDAQGKFQHSLLDTGGACLLVSQFTLLANIDANAVVDLNLDVFNNGTFEHTQRLPIAKWEPLAYRIVIGQPFAGVRFQLAKSGSGTAQLANIGARLADNCDGLPVIAPGLAPLGSPCSARIAPKCGASRTSWPAASRSTASPGRPSVAAGWRRTSASCRRPRCWRWQRNCASIWTRCRSAS